MANDAAYNMAAQLLAALLNLSAGAETCTTPNGGVVAAVNQAQTLLVTIGFNGTGSYLTKSNNANYQTANNLAGIR